MENPGEYIESEKYMSWEQFFTGLLMEKTKDSYLKYEKKELNVAYKNDKIAGKIMEAVPKELV